MAEKKKGVKIAEELHTPEKFSELYGEWEAYQGTVEHPVTGKEVSKQALLQEELSEKVRAAFDDLKEKISKKDAKDTDKVREQVWALAKKAYMARYGISEEPEDKDEKKLFEQHVQDHVVQIASRASDKQIYNFEHAMAEIMAADNPIYGRTDRERSAILDALVQEAYVHEHVGEHEAIKGLRLPRLDHLRKNLSSPFYSTHWYERHAKTPREHGYDVEFAKSATSPEIMGTIEDLLNQGEINPKQAFLKAKKYVRRKPAEYEEAA